MGMNRFAKFSLQPFIMQTLNELGFTEPTEIQERIIPKAMKGLSVVGESQTGTGKTLAYLIPILEKIMPEKQYVQAVITAPTRELATQIYQQLLSFTKNGHPDEPIVIRKFIGGEDKIRSKEQLKTQPHIVVGTPRRMHDLIKDQLLFVHKAKMMVVDEADLMFEMGFIEEVDQIASRMPKDLQMLVFSATIPEKLQPFLKKYMENPLFIQAQSKRKIPQNIKHFLLPQRHRNKIDLLAELMQAYNPYLAMIFANTKKTVDFLVDALAKKGIKAAKIHGDLSPRERKKVMKQIHNLEFQYIVATDLASRGIDIEGVSHVIHYELPRDLNFFIHRTGRTGRGKYSGISTVIYQTQDLPILSKIEKLGVVFEKIDLVNGELSPVSDKKLRNNEKEKEYSPITFVQKPKKVKPRYKVELRKKLKIRQRRK